MFLTLHHQKLETDRASRCFVSACSRLSSHLPAEERFAMVQQIRRAALSVYLHLAEGGSRKSEAARKRSNEIARGSAVEMDGALDVAQNLGYVKGCDTQGLQQTLVECFKILRGPIV